MQIIKTGKFVNLPVYEPLEELLGKLYLKVPKLNFQASQANHINGGNEVIYGCDVYNGNEMVGHIKVEWGMYRSQEYGYVYTITSPRIKNRIYPQNAKISRLPIEALKTAVKVYSVASTAAETVSNVVRKMRSEINGVQYNAVRQAERMGDDSLIPLMEFVMTIHKGGMPTIGTELSKLVAKPNLDKMLNTARIALAIQNDFQSGSGVVIREERDGTLTSIELDSKGKSSDMCVHNIKSTYDLNELYQTKLAMLRMLENNQPVESIGIKFTIEQINWYYLTGGDIITTS